MPRAISDLASFVIRETGEQFEREVEGPAELGIYTVWRIWTFSKEDDEYHAHYVIAQQRESELRLFQDFQPFANWLMKAFNAKDVHERRLDWLRSGIAAIITLTLLALVVWAVLHDRATGVDFRWLVGALATTSLGYLLGDWVKKRT